ncbi:MAG: hypothetical protein FWG68_02435 [Defluviitaleaceae bacterium]|nr:hypothetical protein [Defluviitaleaceae bacterium]
MGKRATDPPAGRAGDGRPYNSADRRGDRPRSPVRLIPNVLIKAYAGGRSPVFP